MLSASYFANFSPPIHTNTITKPARSIAMPSRSSPAALRSSAETAESLESTAVVVFIVISLSSIFTEFSIRLVTRSRTLISWSIVIDHLAGFFTHFTLSARVFYWGTLCGVSGDHPSESAGHLHILRGGTMQVIPHQGRARAIREPSVIFYPRPLRHRFRTSPEHGADLVCALIEFAGGVLNPLVKALPDVLVVPLKSVPALEPAVHLLFDEAFAERPGRQAAVDRLTEYFVVLLLREAMHSR